MIRRVVDFALNHRLFVLAFALLLVAGGIVAFHNLPIDAYPDVADNYVEIITQWPRISAEQIEQQVTIPLEIAMNGIPQVAQQARMVGTLQPELERGPQDPGEIGKATVSHSEAEEPFAGSGFEGGSHE